MGEVAVQKKESFWDQVQNVQERVMQRAHEIFQQNGSEAGHDLDDWLAAEKELVWRPAIELKEKNNTVELRVDVAGLEARDLSVEVTEDSLLVKGETRNEKTEEAGGSDIHTCEFQSGYLFRSVQFPKKINADKVKAELQNGILSVTAPIREEASARRLEIQAA